MSLVTGFLPGHTHPGAKRYTLSPVPMVSVTYRDRVFLNSKGIGFNVIDGGGFRAGPILSYFTGRDHTDEARISSLKNISMSIVGGGFVAYRFGPVADSD